MSIADIPDYIYRSKLAHLRSMGIERMSQSATESPESKASFIDALMGQSPNLLDLFDAWGAAICVGGRWTTIGQTPLPAALDDLVQWSIENVRDDVFTTDSLPLLANDPFGGARFKDVAIGMLAISLSPDSYVLCFRPEVIQTVNWGGNPEQAYQEEVAADGKVRLSPRKSFQLWQQRVRLHSLPWQAVDIAAAVELRKSIVNIILRQGELVRFETNPVLADGTNVWVDLSIVPICDPTRKVVMLIAEGHDIQYGSVKAKRQVD